MSRVCPDLHRRRRRHAPAEPRQGDELARRRHCAPDPRRRRGLRCRRDGARDGRGRRGSGLLGRRRLQLGAGLARARRHHPPCPCRCRNGGGAGDLRLPQAVDRPRARRGGRRRRRVDAGLRFRGRLGDRTLRPDLGAQRPAGRHRHPGADRGGGAARGAPAPDAWRHVRCGDGAAHRPARPGRRGRPSSTPRWRPWPAS